MFPLACRPRAHFPSVSTKIARYGINTRDVLDAVEAIKALLRRGDL